MAFKLRSGNSPIFKQVGSEKESVEEYNTRVREQYEDQMQSYADSTTAYENKKQYIEKMKELKEAAEKQVKIVDSTKKKIEDEKLCEEGHTHRCNELNQRISENTEYSELRKTKRKLARERFALHDKNLDLGIYTQDGGDYKNPNDLRPTMPRKPLTQISIDPLKIFSIDSGKDKIELVKSKRKYVTSADGKTKTNLETGEVTKVKTKVKRKRRPGKRKVRNLVTGGWNWIQGQ